MLHASYRLCCFTQMLTSVILLFLQIFVDSVSMYFSASFCVTFPCIKSCTELEHSSSLLSSQAEKCWLATLMTFNFDSHPVWAPTSWTVVFKALKKKPSCFQIYACYCDGCVYKKSSCGLTCNFIYHILKQMNLSRSHQTDSDDGVGSKQSLKFSLMVFVVIIAVSVTSGGLLRMQSSCRVSSRLLKNKLPVWGLLFLFPLSVPQCKCD